MDFLLLILLIPILSSIACGFFGRFLGFKGSKIISTTLIGITSALS
jgi:hypothetical protein